MSATDETSRNDLPDTSYHNGMISRPMISQQPVRSNNGMRSTAQMDQGLTSRFVLSALRQWWMIAAPVGVILALLGSGIVYMLFVPVYEAAAWFKMEERTPYLAFETKDESRSKVFFQTQIETIRSPLVLGPVIKQPEIAQLPEIASKSDKVAWLAKQIQVASVGESELFRILYTSPDPAAAATVVTVVTEAYFALRDQTEGGRNQRVISTLEEEKDKRSQEVQRLRESVRTLANAATGKDPFANTMGEGARMHPLADLESRLVNAQVELTVLDAKIKAAEEELSSNDRKHVSNEHQDVALSPTEVAYRDMLANKAIEESAEVQRQKAMIADKQARLQDLETTLANGRKAPLYVKAAKEIEKDEQGLEQLRKEKRSQALREAEVTLVSKRGGMGTLQLEKRIDELAKMRSDRDACRMMEQTLKQRYAEQRKKVEESTGDTMELAFKNAELTRAEKVFELIAQRALQLQTERGAPSRVTLMQAAEPPTTPVEPFPYRNIALVALASLCLPFALAVGWERLVGRVGDSRSLEQQSPLAVVGEIAHLPTRAVARRNLARIRLTYETRLFQESIESLRTQLSLCEAMKGVRILAITSAVNHEGKTSVAAQLAISFGRATGAPMLLIDGDMRSPDAHSTFKVSLEPGLVNVLSGGCSLEEAIVPSFDRYVHVLPAGKLRTSPHKLLGNGAWSSLIAKVPACYKYAIIDTPPVLAASESLVLARAADVSLVCAMRDVSRLDQINDTIERLTAAGCRPIGTVLNGVPVRKYASHYGSYVSAGKG